MLVMGVPSAVSGPQSLVLCQISFSCPSCHVSTLFSCRIIAHGDLVPHTTHVATSARTLETRFACPPTADAYSQLFPRPREITGHRVVGLDRRERPASSTTPRRRKGFFPVPEVMLEVVTLILEGVKRLILYLPTAPAAPHQSVHRVLPQRQVDDSTEVFNPFLGNLPVFQEVDQKIGMRFIQRHPDQVAKVVQDLSLIVFQGECVRTPLLECRLHLREQELMIALFNPQNEMHVMAFKFFDMRGIRTQPVFSNNHGEMGVILAEFLEETFGGVALAIILGLAILSENRFGHQRNNFACVGMNQRRRQHLMVIGYLAVLPLPLQTSVTMDVVRGKVFRAVEGE